jgi:hypothetical protein
LTGKFSIIWRRSPWSPKVLHALGGRHVGLGEQDGLAPAPLEEVAHLVQDVEVLRDLDAGSLALDEERHRVHPEAGHPELQPEAHDPLDLAEHHGVVRVEVGLVLVEAVEVVLARGAVVRPVGLLRAGEHEPARVVLRALVRPHVPVAERRRLVVARGLEPRMVDRRVVDDEIDDHAHAQRLRQGHALDEVAHRAVLGVDAVVVRDVVAVVPVG